MLESYLEKPYWVVDFLPKQVPENADGRFFSVEEYYLEPKRYAVLREQFSDILLKLPVGGIRKEGKESEING